LEAETESALAQRGLGPEDFIVNSDEAERRELACLLSVVDAGAARQHAALEARTDIAVVTQHTTARCIIQVVDITLVKYQFRNITSLRVVQQKHSGLYSSIEYYKP
jgi:hypothetical protein